MFKLAGTSLPGYNTGVKFDIVINGDYLLTPWCRVLLEKLTGLQLVKNNVISIV